MTHPVYIMKNTHGKEANEYMLISAEFEHLANYIATPEQAKALLLRGISPLEYHYKKLRG